MHAKILKDSLQEQVLLLPIDHYLFAKVESSNTHRSIPTNQPTIELRPETYAKAQVDGPSVRLTIPALTVSLGSITSTQNYNWDCAYANDLPSRLKTPTWAN